MNGEQKPLDLRALGMVTTLAEAIYKDDWESAALVGAVPYGVHQVVMSGGDMIAHCPDNSPRSSILAEYLASMTPQVAMRLIRIAKEAQQLAENLRIAQQLAKATVTAVTINPGDMLVIRTDGELNGTTYDQFAELARNLSQHFPVGTPVMLTNDVDISALDEDAMLQAGWVKAGNQDAELRQQILAWWKDAQYLCCGEGGDYNVFDSDPDFVRTARGDEKKVLDPRTPEQMKTDGWKPV